MKMKKYFNNEMCLGMNMFYKILAELYLFAWLVVLVEGYKEEINGNSDILILL